jgi:dolichyl-phosphate-mannose-protein mannosyltransferase
MKISKNSWYILIILTLSIITRFAFFGFPSETVFDEVHFGKFVNGYFTAEYFFDIHPPLGKLIIAGFARVGGYEAGDFTFDNIGTELTGSIYKFMRFLPSLAGAFLPVLLYLLALQLGFTKNGAALAAAFAIFDNALITQSRFILMDAFMLLFGFASLYFYTKKNFFGTGVCGALAASIKWTGLSFLGIAGILYLFAWLKERNKLRNAINAVIFLVIIPLLVYYSIFHIHFEILSKPGPGDAFMSQEFRDGKLNNFEKFTELNKVMYTANRGLTADHPFTSEWYQWPINQKPIYYWLGSPGQIWLVGNPLVWFLALVGIIFTLLRRPKTSTQKFLLFGYFANLLPFVFIGRVMFIYHYFPALIFAILALAYLLDRRIKKAQYIGLMFIVSAFFIFMSPVTYGIEAPKIFKSILGLFI